MINNLKKFAPEHLTTLIINLIQKQPAADVVEVVHCKNCKHLMFSNCYGECSKGYMGIVSPNDFCSKSVKKGCADNKLVIQFDRIKAMNIEELTEFLCDNFDCDICPAFDGNYCPNGNLIICSKAMKKWLESEVME